MVTYEDPGQAGDNVAQHIVGDEADADAAAGWWL